MTAPMWFKPRNLDEAIRGLREKRTIIGGGAALNSESFPPVHGRRALDLAALPDAAASIRGHTKGLRVGAMTTLQQLLESTDAVDGRPALGESLGSIATPEVRRIATIGGSVAARLPTSDLLPVLCADRARLDLLGADGRRSTTNLVDYLRSPREAIVLGVELGPRRPGAYVRFAGRAGFAPALAGVAAVMHPDGVEVWGGAVAAAPIPLPAGELPPEHDLRDDAYASAWYRRRLLAVLRDRALAALATRLPDKENI
jgi:CO/xanthine dehydrogenase FAD-binding subunit